MTQPGDEVVHRLPLPEEVAQGPDIEGHPDTPATGHGVRRLVIEIVETLALTREPTPGMTAPTGPVVSKGVAAAPA